MKPIHYLLLGLGAVLIIGVLIYNAWQERRARVRAQTAFRADHPDVLLDPAERREPTLGELPGTPAASEPADAEPLVIRDPPRPPPTVPPDQFEAPAGADAVVSSRIDTVALILADDPVMLEQLEPLLDALQSHTTAVNVEGIVDEQWTPIEGAARTSWRELRAGLQLANRSGPVAQEEIAAFNDAIARFAASIDAVSQRESPAAAAARAMELDRFCADTDIEVVVNVVGKAGGTFALARVKALALERGLSETVDGTLERRLADGAIAYVIRRFERPDARPDATYATGLTFALDVPHVADAPGMLAEMVALAEAFCLAFGAELVDDNRRPLTQPGLAAIRRSLEQVFQKMESQGIPAGGALARRLFA